MPGGTSSRLDRNVRASHPSRGRHVGRLAPASGHAQSLSAEPVYDMLRAKAAALPCGYPKSAGMPPPGLPRQLEVHQDRRRASRTLSIGAAIADPHAASRTTSSWIVRPPTAPATASSASLRLGTISGAAA